MAARQLFRRDFSPAQAHKSLAAAEAGLSRKHAVPIRTLEDWWAKFRKEGEEQGFEVQPGAEEMVEEALYRQLLATARRSITDLQTAVRRGDATPAQAAVAKAMMQIIDTHRRRRAAQKKLDEAAAAAIEGGSTKGGDGEELLREAMRAEAQSAATEPQRKTPLPPLPPIEGKGNGGTAAPTPAAEPKTGQTEHQPDSSARDHEGSLSASERARMALARGTQGGS